MTLWIQIGLLGIVLLVSVPPVMAGDSYTFAPGSSTQQYIGSIHNAERDDVLVYLDDVQAGDTIYVLAEGNGHVDPYLILTDATGSTPLAEDNDSGGGVNAALVFEAQLDGNYVLAMFSISGRGTYRLVVGINDPTVLPDLSGRRDEALTAADTFVGERNAVHTFGGAFEYEGDEVRVLLPDLQRRDVIYVYAAGLGFVDTYITIVDATDDSVLAVDDDSGGGFNAALSYEVRAAGDYTVILKSLYQAGNYELVVGVNTPEVLERVSQPTSTTSEHAPAFDCDNIEFGDRPVLAGIERTREGEAFVIHYTLSGIDATTLEYVDVMAEAIERSLDIQFNDLGWERPPADCGEGGDSRLDVYVMDFTDSSAIGQAIQESVVGDNPNTEREEFFAAYSYLAVENDMDFMPGGQALDLMRATVAHEVHHNIQFGYDVNDSFHGFYEAGAVWIETLVYPTLTNAYEYVDDIFNRPDVCVGRTRGPSDVREYGEWVMVDSFVRDLGAQSYQFVWEYMAASQGLTGFYEALEELGTTPQEVVKRMAIRNLILDYALAKRFETTVRVEATMNGTGFVSPQRTGVQELSVDYIALAERSRYTFEVVGDEALTLFVVGIDDTTQTATSYSIGRRGTVDTSQYDYAYVIVLNTTQHTNPISCAYIGWSIQVFDGENDPLSSPDADVWDASQFMPP